MKKCKRKSDSIWCGYIACGNESYMRRTSLIPNFKFEQPQLEKMRRNCALVSVTQKDKCTGWVAADAKTGTRIGEPAAGHFNPKQGLR
jgi:hypothetical protein